MRYQTREEKNQYVESMNDALCDLCTSYQDCTALNVHLHVLFPSTVDLAQLLCLPTWVTGLTSPLQSTVC